MMNLRLACLALLLLVPGLVRAADEGAAVVVEPSAGTVSPPVKRSPKNMLSIAPVSFLLGSFGLEYERVLADPLSLTVSADYRWLSLAGAEGEQPLPTSMTGVSVGVHLFMLGKAPSGLWLGPELGTIFAPVEKDGERRIGTLPRAALQLGYTGLIADIFSISVGAGVQFFSVVPFPSLRMNFGFAF